MLLSPVHIMHKPSRVTKAKARRFWVRPGRTAAWWQNFVDGKVIDEEWRENFRMDKIKTLSTVLLYLLCPVAVKFLLNKLNMRLRKFLRFHRFHVDGKDIVKTIV